jgi:N-acetylmuramoyl-L-alanine amidase
VDNKPAHLRHIVDFYQGEVVVPEKFKEQLLSGLFQKAPLKQKLISPLAKIKKIVIDAGHGGNDPGAIGRSGLREKDVALDVAKRLSLALREEGFQVVMTRASDRFVSLGARVRATNSADADLFISIHANANRVRSLNGFEVYYISPSVGDPQRALATAREASLDLDRACFAAQSLSLRATLWDMIYTSNRAESINLGRSICKVVGRDLDVRVIGIKDARFYVLKGAQIPAILVEIGFLSNSTEERMLKNSYYRQRIVECLKEGIEDYGRSLALAER